MMESLPSFLKVLDYDDKFIHGYVEDEKQVEKLLNWHKKATLSGFTVRHQRDPIGKSGEKKVPQIHLSNKFTAKPVFHLKYDFVHYMCKVRCNQFVNSKGKTSKTPCGAILKVSNHRIYPSIDTRGCSKRARSDLRNLVREDSLKKVPELESVTLVEVELPLVEAHDHRISGAKTISLSGVQVNPNIDFVSSSDKKLPSTEVHKSIEKLSSTKGQISSDKKRPSTKGQKSSGESSDNLSYVTFNLGKDFDMHDDAQFFANLLLLMRQPPTDNHEDTVCNIPEECPPDFFKIIFMNDSVLHGYVRSEQEMEDLLLWHKNATDSTFCLSNERTYGYHLASRPVILVSDKFTPTPAFHLRYNFTHCKCQLDGKIEKGNLVHEKRKCGAKLKIVKHKVYPDLFIKNQSKDSIAKCRRLIEDDTSNNLEMEIYIEVLLPLQKAHSHPIRSDIVKICDEDLIMAIESKKPLYKQCILNSKDSKQVKSLWKQCSEELETDVLSIKKRWTFLKNYFVEQYHIRTGKIAGRIEKEWHLYEKMRFLIPYDDSQENQDSSAAKSTGTGNESTTNVMSESTDNLSESTGNLDKLPSNVSKSSENTSKSSKANELSSKVRRSTDNGIQSTDNLSESTGNSNKSASNVSKSAEKMSKSTTDVSEAESSSSDNESIGAVSESSFELIESPIIVVEATGNLSESTGIVSESTGNKNKAVENMSKSTTNENKSTSSVSESTGKVSERTGNVSVSTDIVIEGNVIESSCDLNESTSIVIEATDDLIESPGKSTGNFSKSTDPHVFQSASREILISDVNTPLDNSDMLQHGNDFNAADDDLDDKQFFENLMPRIEQLPAEYFLNFYDVPKAPPSCLKIIKYNDMMIHGYVESEEQLEELTRWHKEVTHSNFIVRTQKVYRDCQKRVPHLVISDKFTPTSCVHIRVDFSYYSCEFYGRYKSKSNPDSGRMRQIGSKRQNCLAKMKIWKQIVFIDATNKNCTRREMQTMKKLIRDDTSTNFSHFNTKICYEVQLPMENAHNHQSRDMPVKIDDEVIANAVEHRKPLYDKHFAKAKNRRLISELWEQCAEELGTEVAPLKERWGYLRRYFVHRYRDHLRKKAGLPAPPMIKMWPLYKKLKFLIPHIQARRLKGVKMYEETPDFVYMPPNMPANMSINTCSSDSEDLDWEPRLGECATILSKGTVKRSLQSEEQSPKAKKSCQTNLSSMSSSPRKLEFMEGDDDAHFLESLLPLMRQLGPSAGLEFRIEAQSLMLQYQKRSIPIQVTDMFDTTDAIKTIMIASSDHC